MGRLSIQPVQLMWATGTLANSRLATRGDAIMSLHPWTIGCQTINVVPPRPTDLPASAEWPALQLAFSVDPNDSSIKRLRIVPPDPSMPAAEVELTGNGVISSTVWQPRDRKAWDHSLPPVIVGSDGAWHHLGAAGTVGAALTDEELTAYDALAKVYGQPPLQPENEPKRGVGKPTTFAEPDLAGSSDALEVAAEDDAVKGSTAKGKKSK